MTIEDAYILGYIVTIVDSEKWAFRRNPLMYPHDYTWFNFIDKEERDKYGVLLEEVL